MMGVDFSLPVCPVSIGCGMIVRHDRFAASKGYYVNCGRVTVRPQSAPVRLAHSQFAASAKVDAVYDVFTFEGADGAENIE